MTHISTNKMKTGGLFKVGLSNLESLGSNEILIKNLRQGYDSHLCFENDRILYSSFESSKKHYGITSYSDYQHYFVNKNRNDLFAHCPVAIDLLQLKETRLNLMLSIVLERLSRDKEELKRRGFFRTKEIRMVDLNTGFGDFHNGQATTILFFDNDKRLVYKPVNGAISYAYNNLMNWVNIGLGLSTYGHSILDRGSYHWQEYLSFEHIDLRNNLSEYYYRAGVVLSIAHMLNSSDYHYENIIVNNECPILIDHETLLTPRVSSEYTKMLKTIKGHKDTVMSTHLLPTKEDEFGLYPGMCGFGYSKQKIMKGFKKVGVNRFTDNWSMRTEAMVQNFAQNNVPIHREKRVYPNEHLQDLIRGFEACYRFILSQKNFLLYHEDSPIQNFRDKRIRFIWRPTNVYNRILEYMGLPKNLKKSSEYEERIVEYLMIAFNKVPRESSLRLILKHEISQMLRSDIPYFGVNTSSRDLPTENGIVKNFFELSCVENTERKIKKLSIEDMEYQKELILSSYDFDRVDRRQQVYN